MKKLRQQWSSLFPITLRDIGTTLGILCAATLICFLLRTVSTTDFHVPLIFVCAVMLISFLTQGYFFGLVASVISVFGVNYAFTYPYFAFNFSLTGYPLTFIVSFVVSIITCTLATRVRQGELLRGEAEREKLRADLLRAISHDLRTPLTAIVGAVNVVLEDDGTLSENEKRSLLTGAKSDAEWLTNMVENLLSITRIENDGPAVHTEPQAVEEIAAEAVSKFRRQYPDIPLEVQVPEELLLVPMDAMLIEQVIINLLMNAAIHGKTVSEIRLSVRQEADRAVFTVADNGEGIRQDLLPLLFNRAVRRAAVAADDASRNMGIGLTVCSAIIRAHGGEIRAENLPGRGALFSFTLPLERGTECAGTDTAAEQ